MEFKEYSVTFEQKVTITTTKIFNNNWDIVIKIDDVVVCQEEFCGNTEQVEERIHTLMRYYNAIDLYGEDSFA